MKGKEEGNMELKMIIKMMKEFREHCKDASRDEDSLREEFCRIADDITVYLQEGGRLYAVSNDEESLVHARYKQFDCLAVYLRKEEALKYYPAVYEYKAENLFRLIAEKEGSGILLDRYSDHSMIIYDHDFTGMLLRILFPDIDYQRINMSDFSNS